MTYKEFKRKLLELDLEVSEFSDIFGMHRGTITNMKSKENISNQVKNYILILEECGVANIKKILNKN